MKRWLILLATGWTLVVTGCGMSEEKGILMAAGSYGDLAVVVSDDQLRPVAERFLTQLVTEKTFVIKPEPIFNADIFEPERWDLAKGYKNVLFLVHTGHGGQVVKAAKKQVSGGAWERVVAAGGGVVQAKDPWCTYQHLVIAAAGDRNYLGSVLARNADKIREIYEQSNRERILRRNRYEGLNTNLVNACMDRLGFFLEVPGQYAQNQLQPDGYPGVELMRNGPSRGITVSWMETDDPTSMLADRAGLIEMRRRMGEKLHDEDILRQTFEWSEVEFRKRAVPKLEGAWTSNKFSGGGAFWCYFFADEDRGRVYCVDLLVFAPGMDKMPLFRRMEAIASTFSFERPQP